MNNVTVNTNTNSNQVFNFGDYQVRTVIKEGEPWFVAKDVCSVLEVSNNRDAISRLDYEDKAEVAITDTSSNGVTQSRTLTIINESGLYSLILTSRKPEAKAFKKWVLRKCCQVFVNKVSTKLNLLYLNLTLKPCLKLVV